MEAINIRLDTAEENSIVLEDVTIETISNKAHKDKRLKKINRASGTCRTISKRLMYK